MLNELSGPVPVPLVRQVGEAGGEPGAVESVRDHAELVDVLAVGACGDIGDRPAVVQAGTGPPFANDW